MTYIVVIKPNPSWSQLNVSWYEISCTFFWALSYFAYQWHDYRRMEWVYILWLCPQMLLWEITVMDDCCHPNLVRLYEVEKVERRRNMRREGVNRRKKGGINGRMRGQRLTEWSGSGYDREDPPGVTAGTWRRTFHKTNRTLLGVLK